MFPNWLQNFIRQQVDFHIKKIQIDRVKQLNATHI